MSSLTIDNLPLTIDNVQRSTPQPIHHLRCYALRTSRALSEARFDCYSSGSQSF